MAACDVVESAIDSIANSIQYSIGIADYNIFATIFNDILIASDSI